MNESADRVTITHQPRGKGGVYVARIEGESAQGTLEWEPRGAGERVATHTIVPRSIGGRGVAGLLVERLIADAREQGFRIVPQCSYVARKFADHAEWADLRA